MVVSHLMSRKIRPYKLDRGREALSAIVAPHVAASIPHRYHAAAFSSLSTTPFVRDLGCPTPPRNGLPPPQARGSRAVGPLAPNLPETQQGAIARITSI